MASQPGADGSEPRGEPHEVDRAARGAVREFGFPDTGVTRFERMPRGIMNHTYRVSADGEEWILKRHLGAHAPSRTAATHLLELALADAGAPVPQLRRTLSGSTTVGTDHGLFTMHAWVDGQQISIAERDATHAGYPVLADALGTIIGAIHRQGASVRTGMEALDARTLVEGPRRAIRSIHRGPPHRLRKVARLRRRPEKTEFDSWILASLPGLSRDAAALATSGTWSFLDPQDTVLDHYDLNWENLVFDPGFNVLAVLDWDNASIVPRALAVGGAAAVLIGPDPDRLQRFTEAYSRDAGVAPDPRAVNVGMHLKCLQSTLRSIDAYLSGRVQDSRMLEPWCRHLQECRLALPPVGAAP